MFIETRGIDVGVEQVGDGRLRCTKCRTTWYPRLDGQLQPTMGSLRCPNKCGTQPPPDPSPLAA